MVGLDEVDEQRVLVARDFEKLDSVQRGCALTASRRSSSQQKYCIGFAFVL